MNQPGILRSEQFTHDLDRSDERLERRSVKINGEKKSRSNFFFKYHILFRFQIFIFFPPSFSYKFSVFMCFLLQLVFYTLIVFHFYSLL
jgi:hypothetical protein